MNPDLNSPAVQRLASDMYKYCRRDFIIGKSASYACIIAWIMSHPSLLELDIIQLNNELFREFAMDHDTFSYTYGNRDILARWLLANSTRIILTLSQIK